MEGDCLMDLQAIEARPEPAATLADQVAAGTASPIVMDAHADRFTDPAEKTQRRGR